MTLLSGIAQQVMICWRRAMRSISVSPAIAFPIVAALCNIANCFPRSCLDELELSTSHLDSLLRDTSCTLDTLSTLSTSFRAVETQTSAFQKQCEGILSSQERCTKLADDIKENLQYYDFLDPSSRVLNAPRAGDSVRTKEFSDLLKRLDECLDYMQAHVRLCSASSPSNDLLLTAL